MDSPPARPPLDREEAARLHAEGRNITEIAALTGYCHKTVSRALREQGLGPRPPSTKLGRWTPQLYTRWKAMRGKCNRPSHESYKWYGARGIGICEEWESFVAFRKWALAERFKPKLDLGLIKTDQDFSPQNCRWQTRAETVLRAKRENAYRVHAFGEAKAIAAWAEDPRCVVASSCLRRRLNAGYEPEAAITTVSFQGNPGPKRSQPVLEARLRQTPNVSKADWKRAERMWCQQRTTVIDIARSLGIRRGVVAHRFGHLPRPLPPISSLSRRELSQLRITWRRMHAKVSDPTDEGYRFVGAKGIGICKAWQQVEPFLEWAERSGYRNGLWLMLRNRRKNYSPSNSVWMTPKDAGAQRKPGGQTRPTPRAPLEAFGESKSLTAWADDRRCVVSRTTLQRRMVEEWEIEAALSVPAQHPGPPARLIIAAFGERKSLPDWARDPRSSVSAFAIRQRLSRGISPEEAISAPPFEAEPAAPS